MYARIIPSLRTPRGIDAFDYEIPEGMGLKRGDLVRIPFRTSSAIGIVDELRESIDHAGSIKPLLGSYSDIHFSTKTIDLLHALAEHSFSSLPAIAHAWLGTLPKKPKESRLVGESVSRLDQMELSSLPTYRLTDLPTLLNDHIHAEHGVISTAKEKISQGQSVLILTPWTERAKMIARELDTTALTSGIAAGKRFRLWNDFLHNQTNILVATRIGAWLSCEADCVILDEPENDDHKQDELSPRYDARWLADYASTHGVEVMRFGLTPRLQDVEESRLVGESVSREDLLTVENSTDRLTDSPTHRLINVPDINPDIEWVDVNRRDWSDVGGLQNRTLIAIEEAHESSRPICIIHPIHGDRAGLRCADCHWHAICGRCGASPTLAVSKLQCHRCGFVQDAPLECPSCGGVDLSFTRPGRDRLAQDLAKQGIIDAHIFSIGEWQEEEGARRDSESKLTPLVVLTDLSLYSGACEDIRRREHVIIAWRRLADLCKSSGAKLIVQGDPDLLNHAREWLNGSECLQALHNEADERKQFGYPPAYQLVKIIFRGSCQTASDCMDEMRRIRDIKGPQSTDDSPNTVDHGLRTADIAINGPFEVKFRPSHRGERWIGHVISSKIRPISPQDPIFEPAKQAGAIIDLDPIAFFE
ncbi:MAG: hypothetical protein WC477_00990 [Patescibacteria group bacterium]